jgi:hypothetical protein
MALNNGAKLTEGGIAESWAKYTVHAWQNKIKKLKITDTNTLLNSFMENVIAGANGDVIKIQFTFVQYGRFLDMGVGKGVKIGGVKQSTISRRMEGKMIGNRRRPKKWYTKTLRHEVLRLTEIMAEYYGKSVIDMITENFAQIQENYGNK